MNAIARPSLLVGCAAGFSGDRTDAAGPVVDTLIARLAQGSAGQRAFLIFETLAERTLALAQLRRRADPEAGYEPLLDAMLRPVLARCLAHGVGIVSNFGAANPRAAARHILRLARELDLPAPRIAVRSPCACWWVSRRTVPTAERASPPATRASAAAASLGRLVTVPPSLSSTSAAALP